MLCEICNKNEATGYYRQTVNGKTKSVRICSHCFYEKQSEFLGTLNTFSGYVDTEGKKLKCSKCGRRLDEIKKTLFVGCPNCYMEMEQQLDPLIKNLQNAYIHTGSSPQNNFSEPSKTNLNSDTAFADKGQNIKKSKQEEEIARLREQLKRAIEEERYEDAESLSGRIKLIKNSPPM